MIGQVVSHYKILEKLGEGGMGIVYKAQDTKLDRFVALKFLPERVSSSEQDRARFLQEAKAASALNHPNICTIHGIEEHEGQMFIIMELIDGVTLGDKKNSISFKQALDIGVQLAEGLAAAHEKGIVHRDIKPDNIMIRKDGITQIMDFGLAKLRGVSKLTKEGSTVGTAGYMSPEQVQGTEADHRSDIFSLGVLLYELLTGQLPFKGVHETALLYEIVNVDVAPMSSIKPEIDPSLDAIILECLEKDPNERMQSAKQLANDLKRFKRESSRTRVSRVMTAVHPAPKTPDTHSSEISSLQKRERIAWILASLFLIISVLSGTSYFLRPREEGQTIRTSLLPPEKSVFNIQGGPNVALSPNGRLLAFIATDSTGKNYLYVRPLHVLSALLLPGTAGATYPFWSPDNKFVGFFSAGKLMKIEANGGPPITICDAPAGRGGTWNRDGIIIFAPDQTGGLFQIPAAGGTPKELTRLDTTLREQTHRWPQFLPDGKHFLYFARASAGNIETQNDAAVVGSLDGTMNKRLMIIHSNILYANGYLLFLRERTLMAQLFDLNKFELTGDASPIAEQIQYDPSYTGGNFSVSENGLLTYQSSGSQTGFNLFWYDRSGKSLELLVGPANINNGYLSPDGKKMTLQYYDQQSRNFDLWIYELSRKIRTRFTFDPSIDGSGIWSPDGSKIAFWSDRKGHGDIYVKASSGAGTEDILFESVQNKRTNDWSSDGNYILFTTTASPTTKNDQWVLPLTGDRKPYPFLQTDFNEGTGRFSPDVKWIAYNSDESGRVEVYVRPFPGPGGKWQVSVNGGFGPRWRRDGKELYYLSTDQKLMAAEIKYSGSAFEVSAIKTLFDIQSKGQISFDDVTADGQKFLIRIATGGTAMAPLTLVTNWTEELRKK